MSMTKQPHVIEQAILKGNLILIANSVYSTGMEQNQHLTLFHVFWMD
jgi:hypothetical protein